MVCKRGLVPENRSQNIGSLRQMSSTSTIWIISELATRQQERCEKLSVTPMPMNSSTRLCPCSRQLIEEKGEGR